MKTFISIMLAAAITWVPFESLAQTNAPTSKPVTTQVKDDKNIGLICFLILSATAAGIYIVWKVHSSTCGPPACTNKRLILECNNRTTGEWVPIATNDIAGVCTNPIEVFRTRMTDDTAWYRVQITDIPRNMHLVP